MPFEPTAPTTDNLCSFSDPTTRDPGRDWPIALAPGCEAPTFTAVGGSTISFVDGEPVATLD